VPAIGGFFRSIALGKERALQDMLRLLTLWFKYGATAEVDVAVKNGFDAIAIDTWLSVTPQIIARIHSPNMLLRRSVNMLLSRVAKEHPQGLIYPLTVASKSQSQPRKTAALRVLQEMRKQCDRLVEQAALVSAELIRTSILWHEMWHAALEDASRFYFGLQDIDGMLATLDPLHAILQQGAETSREESFLQAFGNELRQAHERCERYRRTQSRAELHAAWDIYYQVFRRISKQISKMSVLELQHVSPKLLEARDLELAVPGTYQAGAPVVSIRSFAHSMTVISSKQRPRKLVIQGSDGSDHLFLLKGHEDLRQDERVMQLFGLVNTLLSTDARWIRISKQDLAIQRYSVIPLSPNSGLISWVANCDTLHALIKEFRDARKMVLNVEHRLMLQLAPDYDGLPVLNKLEAFEHALQNTDGQDVAKVLWLRSLNAEHWLMRRTNYTRSLAVMSMVGDILGLGDRHPSNLMLDRLTGKILHIDFGDCFEVAIHREKFPEKIPFRLTRMLVNAMEVSGVEGNFRSTCEAVMGVLRKNKDSVMAMLEAFVHDPLINWRLMQLSPEATPKRSPEEPTSRARSTSDSRARHSHDQHLSPPMGVTVAAAAEEGISHPASEIGSAKVSPLSTKVRPTPLCGCLCVVCWVGGGGR
jgi:FKBP12-rapamycin complex-associated protein